MPLNAVSGAPKASCTSRSANFAGRPSTVTRFTAGALMSKIRLAVGACTAAVQDARHVRGGEDRLLEIDVLRERKVRKQYLLDV